MIEAHILGSLRNRMPRITTVWLHGEGAIIQFPVLDRGELVLAARDLNLTYGYAPEEYQPALGYALRLVTQRKEITT